MAKQIRDLDVRIRDLAAIQPRFLPNRAYLEGRAAQPILGGNNDLYRYAGYALMLISAVIFPLYVAGMIFVWLWTSPYTMTTEGTIDGLRPNWEIEYSYEVDGVRYEKVERYPSRNDSWADGGVPQTVVYISFLPSQSRLPRNIEEIEWFPVIFVGIMILAIGFMGYALQSDQRQMRKLSREATHVLEGEIVQISPFYRGILVAVYHANSPTGKRITGSTRFGRHDEARRRFDKGARVAVLYRDDQLHTLL